MNHSLGRLGLSVALSGLLAASVPAQFGLFEPPPPTNARPTASTPAPRGADSFVVTFDQGSGTPFRDLIPEISTRARAQGQTVHGNTFLLVADVSHQMVQVQAEGSVHAPTWDAEARALQESGDAANLRRHQETVRAWEGRFVSYEHHGPVASLEAKAQNMPNAASMIMRDWEPLSRSLHARYQQALASGGPPPNIGIVIHGFSDADAISSKMLMQELASRMTGSTPLGTPIDPILENIALVQARNADQGNLGRTSSQIHRTLEGALEGVNYEIESQVSRRNDLSPEQKAELKSRLQVEATTEFMETFMKNARETLHPGKTNAQIAELPVEQRIPESRLAELVDQTKAELARPGSRSPHAQLHRQGADRAERYGQEVSEAMKKASARPGEVIRLEGEFVKSASLRPTWVEVSGGGMKQVLMLSVEISQPPISKAAFWSAYNTPVQLPANHPAAQLSAVELVLIKGEGFVNWFAGSKRGLSLKGITAPLADAPPPTEKGGKFVHKGRHGNWAQNFPAFKGAAYDWAISLGSIDFNASGSDIHGLGREIASEGQRLAETGGHLRGRPSGRPGSRPAPSRVMTEAERSATQRLGRELMREAPQHPNLAEAQKIFETGRRMVAEPGNFPMETIMELPELRTLPSNRRRTIEENLRRVREPASRGSTGAGRPGQNRGRPGSGGYRFRARR